MRSDYGGYGTAIGVAALIVAAGIPLIGPTTLGEAAETPETTFTALNWTAPDNFTGNLAVGVQIHTTETTWCESDLYGEGRVEDDSPPLLHWTWDGQRGDFWLNQQEALRAHARGEVDTRSVAGQTTDGAWWYSEVKGQSIPGNKTLGLVFADLNVENVSVDRFPITQSNPPYQIDVSCSNAVDVDLSAGRDVVPLTHQSMTDDGVGAATRIPRVSVQDQAQKTARFEASKVLFQGQWETGEDRNEADERMNREGRLRLHHPDGTVTWDLETVDHPGLGQPMMFSGASGRYTAELNLVRADVEDEDSRHTLAGILAGLDPVDSLDEVV